MAGDDNIQFAEGFISDRVEEAPYDYHPRVIPFGVGSPEQYEVLSQPAASLALFLEEETPGVGFFALGSPLGGMFIGMQPNQLRGFAAGVVNLADQLDGGKGKQ